MGTLRQEEANMATIRREDAQWLPFAEKMRDDYTSPRRSKHGSLHREDETDTLRLETRGCM